MDIMFVSIALVAFIALSWRNAMKKAMTASGANSSKGVDYIDNEVNVSDSDTQSSDYFTYETIDLQPSPVNETTNPVLVDSIKTEQTKPDFDLRQAVIYQTILCNEYISEIK